LGAIRDSEGASARTKDWGVTNGSVATQGSVGTKGFATAQVLRKGPPLPVDQEAMSETAKTADRRQPFKDRETVLQEINRCPVDSMYIYLWGWRLSAS
jgi:hypothetical protein